MHRSMISLVMRGGLVLLVSLTLTHKTHAGNGPTVGAVGATSSTVRVINTHDAGPGSFRQAILDANNHPSIQRIVFATRVGTVALQQPVEYTGPQALSIEGNRATLDGAGLPAGASGFLASGGGDLTVTGLTIRGAPGVGLTVAVPGNATETIKVSLINFAALNNGLHGVLINDQAEYFDDPNSTSPDGSDASLDVVVIGSHFKNNGFKALDQDGLRINEGGVGNLKALIHATHVEDNGGDGVELDERDVGAVLFNVVGTTLHGNGGFASADFDDGIDIDESGAGSIIGTFFLTSANHNFEQGFDLNENDAGDLRVDMLLVEASGNRQEGIEYEEDDDVAGGGDIIATLVGIKTRGNGVDDGDAGLKLREKGVGNLDVRLLGIESSDNSVSGIQLREDADGNLTARIQNVITDDNNVDGIEFDENGAGNLDGTVEKTTSSNNTGAGIRADQGGAGAGTLKLIEVTTFGNGAGAIVANAGVTVIQTP